jgi:TRAP-type uncharacterized transport system fused permease subunit
VPFMFVFEPSLLMIGDWKDIASSVLTATLGTICLAAGLFGYLVRPARTWERILLIAAALLLIKPGIVTDMMGAALLVVVVLSQLALARATPVASAAAVNPGNHPL